MLGLPIFLAVAAGDDTSDFNLVVVLACLGIICGACILAAIPVVIAARRRNRHARTIMGAAVLWALVACLILMPMTIRQLQWPREHAVLIASGYFDPRDNSDALWSPWWVWALPGVLYCPLLIMPLLQARRVENGER